MFLSAAYLGFILTQANNNKYNRNEINVGMINTPGLYCKTVDIAMVYNEPKLSSKILGRIQNYVAVTGKEVNGFIPIVTGLGVKGWVMENQTLRENTFAGRPCRVQMLPDGRLLFGIP